jgi:hypothetical protein
VNYLNKFVARLMVAKAEAEKRDMTKMKVNIFSGETIEHPINRGV